MTTSAAARSGRLLLFMLLLVVLVPEMAQASNPRLSTILPRGVQRGGQHTLRMIGERIGEAQQILIYDVGISVVEIKKVDGNQIDVVVDVTPDCRLGEHVLQIRTPRGLSDFRSVYVGHLPSMDEVEPNSSMEGRQVVEMNRTIQGTITGEDVDYFAVTVTKGQRISAEVEAIRLGTLFDPFIAILNEERFELAVSDDTPLFSQDPFVSIIAPEDGTYTILVRESSYGGNDACRYRLHLGDFPRPTAVYPAGGPLAQPVDLKFLGDPSGDIAQNVTLPANLGFRPGLEFVHESGITPSPLPFRLNDLPNFLEVEPNDTWVTEPVSTLPQAFNGVIGQPGDMDYFLFEAKQGEVWEVECFARRIGSGLDPVFNIFKASDKSHIVGNDDSRGPDSYVRFQVPETGQYYLRIYDHLKRGQSDFVYRVEMNPVATALTLSIPRVDRYSQQLQTICVPQGNRFGTLINASKENFAGELKLLEDNLPPGIKMIAKPMAANLDSMPVVFEADANAELNGYLVDLQAQLIDETRVIKGGFSNLADFANGEPNNAPYYQCRVDRLAMAVTQAAPFSIEIVQPQAPLVRDGSLELQIIAKRAEGFTAPINLQFPFRPPGLGTTNQITIPEGQSSIAYPLNANANAQLGVWPIFVIGNSAVDGGALWTSSQLADLTIAEPLVTVTVPRAGCEQGESAPLICTLEHLTPFEGEATLTLLGLPPNATAEPQTFTKDTTELVFQIPITDQVPVGQHKSLFCQLSIPFQGEKIASSTGKTELQVNKPTPAPVAQAAPPPQPAADTPPPPVAKPLSRLEQLRQKVKEQTDGANQ